MWVLRNADDPLVAESDGPVDLVVGGHRVNRSSADDHICKAHSSTGLERSYTLAHTLSSLSKSVSGSDTARLPTMVKAGRSESKSSMGQVMGSVRYATKSARLRG